jgi:two-component system chemotaxis sensor kinase CheA
MLEMYIFETSQNIDQLEEAILESEQSNCFSEEAINGIFRIMHTIKGSSAMMLFNEIATLAHSVEDVFFYLREQKPENVDCSTLSDLIFESIDFMKVELEKIKNSDKVDGDASILIGNIKEFLEYLKHMNPNLAEVEKPPSKSKQQYYIAPDKTATNTKEVAPSQAQNFFEAVILFKEGCEMENIRAYTVIHNLKEFANEITHYPEDIIESDDSIQLIRDQGFTVRVKVDKSYDEMHDFFMQTIFLQDLKLTEISDDSLQFDMADNRQDNVQTIDLETSNLDASNLQVKASADEVDKDSVKDSAKDHAEDSTKVQKQRVKSEHSSIISVNVGKLDQLMDLVGEMVIAEAMVTQNPDLHGLELENFQKAARQLDKIMTELQSVVMSIRMVPLSTTFQKMHRVVRDMSKKLEKDVRLKLVGEETEVDKNIIDRISDPLMHLIRNSLDHGIETIAQREKIGKSPTGTITIEAKNIGSDVLISIKDDGNGLNKDKLLKRAQEHNILTKPIQQMTDREIYNLILLPGFSTKENVSEFSGRGVGMDVVTKNIEAVGGTVSIDSEQGVGSTFTMKIPLTLAIIDGMNITVGKSCYTIPITAIMESFRPKDTDIIKDPNGNEMIMVRGQCYPILRIHRHYDVATSITDLTEGILIMVEQDEKSMCVFADQLLGKQQVVVKALPSYIKNTKKIGGLSGCTVLGDGSISLILDVGSLIKKN